ncbi:beta-carotene ketolase, partial [candidate division KSB1 bacterium]
MKKQIGLYIAILILLTWAVSLIYFLQRDLGENPWLVPAGLLVLTFLYTGLFITAHDAIHGAILPGKHKWNAAIGAFCLFVYALFPYSKIRRNHFDHHRYPGSLKDPDYHDGLRRGFWSWYLHFLRGYITWWQILGMALIFN